MMYSISDTFSSFPVVSFSSDRVKLVLSCTWLQDHCTNFDPHASHINLEFIRSLWKLKRALKGQHKVSEWMPAILICFIKNMVLCFQNPFINFGYCLKRLIKLICYFTRCPEKKLTVANKLVKRHRYCLLIIFSGNVGMYSPQT